MLSIPVESKMALMLLFCFTNGLLLSSTAPPGDGLPRSQASESKSPNT